MNARATKRVRFLVPESIVQDPKLSPGAKLTYAVVLQRKTAALPIPTMGEIAGTLGCSVTSARGYVRELIDSDNPLLLEDQPENT